MDVPGCVGLDVGTCVRRRGRFLALRYVFDRLADAHAIFGRGLQPSKDGAVMARVEAIALVVPGERQGALPSLSRRMEGPYHETIVRQTIDYVMHNKNKGL